ncbi:hypothetical protein BST81_06720 [Leptolyngbya sp. 'hensonii']|uniref:hypothetical protein n=1 Tax=Leptolyngbya sp. 'hensonii' TaxID=1922337 RepID=UPI00094F9C0C|nr:hypothetical protein [Leptolyngbya sp. 'hensonii']OLP19184.1 hypothetical protein BST81_06720 [Leptolyngbya sp. 'hensonii']
MSELLNNACKYTPAGEMIGEMIMVEVRVEPEQAEGPDHPKSTIAMIVHNSGVEDHQETGGIP